MIKQKYKKKKINLWIKKKELHDFNHYLYNSNRNSLLLLWLFLMVTIEWSIKLRSVNWSPSIAKFILFSNSANNKIAFGFIKLTKQIYLNNKMKHRNENNLSVFIIFQRKFTSWKYFSQLCAQTRIFCIYFKCAKYNRMKIVIFCKKSTIGFQTSVRRLPPKPS